MHIRSEKLDFWIENNFNVLFTGKHGVGKSSIVIEAFERNDLKWAYFSAATMDPWVDFIGIPKEKQDDKGPYLEFIRPENFRDDEIEAIFIDEFNRSHKKIRNAVMELIQYKSINGKKFKNLKIIWAAVNPSEEEIYDVDQIDPAQSDRFHVWIKIPYEPDKEWFVNKYGKEGKVICEWWRNLPDEFKNKITPRRLDYTLEIYNIKGGDIRDCLPTGAPIQKLISALATGPVSDTVFELYQNKNKEEAKKWLASENNYVAAFRYLTKPEEFKINKQDWYKFFLPTLPAEKLSSLFASNEDIQKFIISNPDDYSELINNIISAGTNKKLIKIIKRNLGAGNTLITILKSTQSLNPDDPIFNKDGSNDWGAELGNISSWPMENTHDRMRIFKEITSRIPENINYNQAVATLELINLTVGRCWVEKIGDHPELIGLINHCLQKMHQNSPFATWIETLKECGEKFTMIIEKLRKANMQERIWKPLN